MLPVEDMWWKGQKWLSDSVFEWPLMEDTSELTYESLEELKTTRLCQSLETSINVLSAIRNTSLGKIIDCTKLRQLWLLTAYVLHFLSNLKKRLQKMEVSFSSVLTAEEIRKPVQQDFLHNSKCKQ